jgi:hypothetical protein
MVELAEIQTAYYMIAATGVLVAAGYHILNIRETMKNRRATFANNLLQIFLSEQGQMRIMELLQMQWSDFEDFRNKYDSSVNPESYAKRAAICSSFNSIGQQIRSGIIDLDAIDDSTAYMIVVTWSKFGPIFERYRELEWSKDYLSDFEYLSDALMKRFMDRDPDIVKKMNVGIANQEKR